jgi:hypothetical protein
VRNPSRKRECRGKEWRRRVGRPPGLFILLALALTGVHELADAIFVPTGRSERAHDLGPGKVAEGRGSDAAINVRDVQPVGTMAIDDPSRGSFLMSDEQEWYARKTRRQQRAYYVPAVGVVGRVLDGLEGDEPPVKLRDCRGAGEHRNLT